MERFGLLSSQSPTDWNLFYSLGKQKEAFLFPVQFSWFLRRWTQRPTGLFVEPTPVPPELLLPLPPFQTLHCTILVQHDMHIWLLPSLAIKTLPLPKGRGAEASPPSLLNKCTGLIFLTVDYFARHSIASCGLYVPPSVSLAVSAYVQLNDKISWWCQSSTPKVVLKCAKNIFKGPTFTWLDFCPVTGPQK